MHGVLIPSPWVKTTPETFTIKVRRPHVLVFPMFSLNKRWWRLRPPSSLGRRTCEPRIALSPKGRFRHLHFPFLNSSSTTHTSLFSPTLSPSSITSPFFSDFFFLSLKVSFCRSLQWGNPPLRSRRNVLRNYRRYPHFSSFYLNFRVFNFKFQI